MLGVDIVVLATVEGELLNDDEAVTVVVVVSLYEDEPEVICGVEVDFEVLDVVGVVNMDDIGGVVEGISVVIVLVGIFDEALDDLEGIIVEAVAVEKIVDFDAGIE